MKCGLQSVFQISQSPIRIPDDKRKLIYKNGGSWRCTGLKWSTGDCKIRSSCSAEGVVIAHLLISAVKKLLPNWLHS